MHLNPTNILNEINNNRTGSGVLCFTKLIALAGEAIG
jgi:hypothetical protein